MKKNVQTHFVSKSSRRRARCTSLLAVSLAGAVFGVSAMSAAQTDAERYDELLQRADAALRDKRLREALATWHVAWSLKQSDFVACNIGRAERLIGSAKEAAGFLSLCLRLSPVPTTPDEKRRLGQFAADLKHARSQVAALTIAATESGASIRIDDRVIGKSPLPGEVFVEPGEHRISAILEGFEQAHMTISVYAGEVRTIPIVFTKSTPRSKATMPPIVPLALETTPSPSTSHTWTKPWIVRGASFATVGLGLGVGLLIARGEATDTALTSKQEVRLRNLNNCTHHESDATCSRYIAAENSRATLQGAATASLVMGGLAAAATIGYALFPRSRVAPSIGSINGFKVSF